MRLLVELSRAEVGHLARARCALADLGAEARDVRERPD
jgi:hypothetical protein